MSNNIHLICRFSDIHFTRISFLIILVLPEFKIKENQIQLDVNKVNSRKREEKYAHIRWKNEECLNEK